MAKRALYIITQSKEKIRIAEHVFGRAGIEIKFHKTTHPEIQADSGIEVAMHAAVQEAKELNMPVVREDHSLYIRALGKVPGPYTNYIERMVPVRRMAKLMSMFKDRSAYYELCAVFSDSHGNTKSYSFRVPIVFIGNPKGKASVGWDQITCFPGSKKTFAEYTEKDRTAKTWLEKWDKNFTKIALDIKSGKIKV